jgi:chromosome segregation ATPase
MTNSTCSLALALLLSSTIAFSASPLLAATDPGQAAAPAAVNTRNSAVFVQPASASAAGTSKPSASDSAPGAANAPVDPEMMKLKHQIKSVRLSLAETQGRLAVTEKDLVTGSSENTQLRADNGNLRVGLAKAETVAKKSEDELSHRRQEVKTLVAARPSSTGVLAVGLLLSLAVTGILAVLLFRQGGKLGTIATRLDETVAQDKRHDQVRALLKDEQQRAQRLDEEIKRLRVAAESQPSQPAGGKRDKLDNLRRELREARTAAEAEKRQADERIQTLEAELLRLTADKRQSEERVQKLEPVREQLEKLEPEVERLTAEKTDAEQRSRALAHSVARVTAEKLRLEHALAKANEKLVFLGQEEAEDTLPPIVG